MTIEEIIRKEREESAAREERTFFKGFKVSYLRELFNGLTAGMPNWKVPFSVPGLMGEEVMAVVAAIGYFTGDGEPEIVCDTRVMRYTVSTVGYYRATGECYGRES